MKYSVELKDHILNKIFSGEARVCDMAKQYSIPEKRVSLWVSQRRRKDGESANLSKEELLKRISLLEKENKRLSEDCDILKKATALFASKQKAE